ncbi:PD-(D/E)XK nuclease family protein [Alteribacillus bidgolensis]|uniref:PD-(D/E)XK nuclease superfamily protein n=1 Tax=Alteribacillus bidgolensis TaxID=930129 RepID=A0A1G8QQU1_9BACI|nr:PD-(D/E)XK nuclease family protein [Alteribacillus bidgolensis]SDJ06715.1 PD-(D/E)XK nuclease superfamily protein [Alteribacillus bidgolensis]
MKNHLISIPTMTEHHLRDFIRCPYKFYYQHVEKKKSPLDWRQRVQYVVNQVVDAYYQLPPEHQRAEKVLELIGQYWEVISPRLFESKVHYYMAAAKVTDHLMQYLTAESKKNPPLFLFEKFKAPIQEIGVDLSLTFDAAEWSCSSFVVKKYLVEADEEMVKLFHYLTTIFSEKAFNRIPKRIEVITLMDGKKHVFFPTHEDVQKGINYLQLIKHLLEDSSRYNGGYNEKECPVCPFQKVCHREERGENRKKYLS